VLLVKTSAFYWNNNCVLRTSLGAFNTSFWLVFTQEEMKKGGKNFAVASCMPLENIQVKM
jgi:hypothetical protein